MARTACGALLLALGGGVMAAQPAVDIEGDPILKKLRAALPAGWRLAADGGTLRVERAEQVFVLGENKINAPASRETPEARAERIRTHGRQARPAIVLRAEKRWTEADFAKAKASDEGILQRVDAAAKRLGVEPLRLLNTKPGGSRGKTDEERARWAAFEKERGELEAGAPQRPGWASERYSLFLLAHEGWSDPMHSVAPQSAEEESYRVHELVTSLLAVK